MLLINFWQQLPFILTVYNDIWVIRMFRNCLTLTDCPSPLEFSNRSQLQSVDRSKFSQERLALKIMVLPILSLLYVSAYIKYNISVKGIFQTMKKDIRKKRLLKKQKKFFLSLKLVKLKYLLNQPTKRP